MLERYVILFAVAVWLVLVLTVGIVWWRWRRPVSTLAPDARRTAVTEQMRRNAS